MWPPGGATPKKADSGAADLAALAQCGHEVAYIQLLIAHRRIVATLANRYARTDLSSDQLIRLGEQGLGVAIERFNPSKGFSFSTYATWWIRQAITRGLGGEAGGALPEPRSPRPTPGSASAVL